MQNPNNMYKLPELTERQRMCLQFMIDFVNDHGFHPGLRDIGAHMHIKSTNGVHDHLRALERKGYILRKKGFSRSPVLLHCPLGRRIRVNVNYLSPNERVSSSEMERGESK